MSTLRTHRDYVQALAYAKDKEQVGLNEIVCNSEFLTIFPIASTGGQCWSRQSNLFMGRQYIDSTNCQ